MLQSTSYAPPPQKGKTGRGKHQTHALAILQGLHSEAREQFSDEGKDPDTARVSLVDWKNTLKDDGMPAQRIPEVIKKLQELGSITERGGYVSPL